MLRHTTIALAVLFASPALADNWPAWRGPLGTGIAQETKVPLKWSQDENVKWRTPLPAPGNSTPIVWGERIFLTGAEDEGAKRSLMCFDRKTGKLLWQQTVDYDKQQPTHKTNPYCSSSPVTDGKRIVVWHGSAGAFCYDFEGKLLWKKDFGQFEHIWGTASSPVLYKNLVILSCGPGLSAFIVALDVNSGEQVWRVEPEDAKSEKVGEFRGSWSTPVLHTHDGRTELLLSMPLRLMAFDPESGETIWQCEGLSKLAYTSPLIGDGIAVAMSGYHGPALAVRLGGQGDVTESHRLWLHDKRNPQRVGSGVVVDGHIYILNEPGIAWCIELKSGEKLWEQRLEGGKSWSSMCYVDGRLYVLNMQGTTLVLEPNPAECKILAENPLGELTRGSLAFSDGQVFARTYDALYCIEDGGTKAAEE